MRNLIDHFLKMAEGVGFEPTVLSHNGFQDRRLKPLGHPSFYFLIVIQCCKNVKFPYKS